jgi:hypothetical protein
VALRQKVISHSFDLLIDYCTERKVLMADLSIGVIGAGRMGSCHAVAVSSDGLAFFQEAYVSELTHWLHSVQTEQAFTGATAWDGYMSLLVSDACIQSLHSGTPVPVSTPAKPGHYQERELQGGAHVN